MIQFKRALRAAGIIAISLWSTAAMAQSVLNFTVHGGGAAGITNPTPYAADVKLTLYNEDGSLVTTGVLNPVSRRIPGKGQLTAFYSEIFRGAPENTWVQVTSPAAGLQGFYFTSDSAGVFDSEATSPQQTQTLSYMATEGSTYLIVTNPSAQATTVSVIFYSAAGDAVDGQPVTLPAHAQVRLPGLGVSARVTADLGVLASVFQDLGGMPILIQGQGIRARGLRLVAPYFKNTSGASSVLLLTNSSAQEVQAKVSFFKDGSNQAVIKPVTLAPNGSAAIDGQVLNGTSDQLADEGWLLVESANAPLSGLVVLSSENARTALPLQSSAVERMLFSRFVDGGDLTAYLSLVGDAERDAVVTVTLSRPDGSTVARREGAVPAMKRSLSRIRDLVPVPDAFPQGFITIQSTVPVYGVELLDDTAEAAEAGVVPLRLPPGFQPGPAVAAPRILGVDVFDSPDGRRLMNIRGENIDNNPQLFVGGRPAPIDSVLSGSGQSTVIAELPSSVEPGYIYVKIRANGIDSNSLLLGVSPDNAEFIVKQGRAVFQKVEVTDAGLDLSSTVMVPIRNARVEVTDRLTGKVISVTETDDQGVFYAALLDRPGLTISVLSRLRSAEVKILDNPASNRLYAIRQDINDLRDSLELVDKSRVSGAFNILDQIQKANALIAQADPQFVPPPITIYWNEKNNEAALLKLTNGQSKTTVFNLSTNTAYVLGDRSTDSDEFDDSVILHEYAHMLAARYSRDESPGGMHALGDVLDPRLAWSEGWANFFSCVAKGSSIFIDSKGPGVVGVRYDLEENSPVGDRKGYWSEASVQSLLWDLFDDAVDDGDSVQFPFASIWNAFTDLRGERYVYLPDFLEHFVKQNPSAADAVRIMASIRNIDFQPDSRPSVVSSFPRPIANGETKLPTDVDSFSSKRTNLANSAHFYSFTTTTGGQAFIKLEIDGLGPANNPDANDLDLYLYDSNGKRVAQSNQWHNGQSEYILGPHLVPGTYYIEVRSFYTRADLAVVFNSGRYRLSLQLYQ